ncbi:MAG: exodeoxyribonuclease V subunit gamma [Methylotetracoccus sp.]
MFKLYPGNRIERLAEQLAEVTATPLDDPFRPELIVTQSLGMAHWLRQKLAECHGIAANLRFMLPTALVWEVLRGYSPDALGERSAFDRDLLAWRLYDELRRATDDERFAPLSALISNDRSGLKRFQLAARIADLFDQYLVFRPDLIASWESGDEPDDWQATLWRRVHRRVDEPHQVALLSRFLDHDGRHMLSPDAVPARLSVFGLCTLPPAHLAVLERLGEDREVHLYFLNPCTEYWGDVEDPRSRARRARWRRGPPRAATFTGHPLLASWGQQGRDFFERLLDTTTIEPFEFADLYENPGEATLLHRLQSDILYLRDPAAAPDRPPIDRSDRSIRIHACHSPMRELEVLHDRLLDLFERYPDLEPRDVIVMAPDIEIYAPMIPALFAVDGVSNPHEPHRLRLPCTIADRAAGAEHPLLGTFLTILALPKSRWKTSEILPLLRTAAVRRRFGLEEAEVERLRRWISESGIRWGRDANHREELGTPATSLHTWDFGLERLFMGYALGSSEALFDGIAPYPDIEGQAAETLGRLQAFVGALTRASEQLAGHDTPKGWTERLNALLDSLFAPDEFEISITAHLREAIAALQDEAEEAGCDTPIGLEIVEYRLRQGLSLPAPGQRFCTGQISFCSLLPMRSLPFRIVCLIGMNDGDFPRRRRPTEFDRIAASPRAGDRSRREDDRYLFLETLLSAREHLHISYVGRSIRDNSPLLPAVPVSELIECLQRDYLAAESRDALIIEHPMQPFSPRYFDGRNSLFSYAAEWLPSSRGLQGPRSRPRPFIASPLDEPDAVLRQIDLERLLKFFRNPPRAFLETRLGVVLSEQDTPPEDCEPFALDALDTYALRQDLVSLQLAGIEAREVEQRFAAEGRLPTPPFDRLALNANNEPVAQLLARLRTDYAEFMVSPEPPQRFAFTLGSFVLSGALQPLYTEGLLSFRPGRLRATDRVRLWLQHLVLQLVVDGPRRSALVAIDEQLELPALPVAQAREHLLGLLDLYWQGLSQPLPLFPEAAYAYARKLAETNDGALADRAARQAWEHYECRDGQVDAAIATAFRGIPDPLAPPFDAIATGVFQPLIEAMVQ